MTIKFELDEYYFNRAGDKVKYVGYDAHREYPTKQVFRRQDTALYHVLDNGNRLIASYSEDDILGKWEINDDPDRVYMIGGVEYTWAEKSGYWLWNEQYGVKTFDAVEKILIKPFNPVVTKFIKEFMESHTSPKKIEPLEIPSDSRALSLTTACLKINELVDAHNKKTENA